MMLPMSIHTMPRRIFASLGIVALVFMVYVTAKTTIQSMIERGCHESFSLLNPRRRCLEEDPVKKQEYDRFVVDLQEKIKEWKRHNAISHITVVSGH